MARQVSKRTKKALKYEWVGHIQVYFNDTERDHVLAYIGERKWDLEDTIATLTQAKYGCKFTYDDSRDSYYLTLQPKEKDNPYLGYTIGITHVEVVRLVQIAAYVVNELIPNGGLELPERSKPPDW